MERKNKFKLVKYKSKLITASFCAIVPLITSVSAIQNNDSSADSDIKAANQAKINSNFAKAKVTTIQAITNIQPSKTLVTGAIEPTTEKRAFDAAVAEAKKAINDATSVADVNSAKASGITSVSTVRNTLDRAIDEANQEKIVHDLQVAKVNAIGAIDAIRPNKGLIAGAIKPTTEINAFNAAVAKAKQAITFARNVADVSNWNSKARANLTAVINTLDRAIDSANQAKISNDLAEAKAITIQTITNIQPSKTLVAGAIEPTTEKRAFVAAIAEAKKAINDATSVADVNSAKASGITSVTLASDAFDGAIDAANWNKEISEVKTTSLNLPKAIKTKLPSEIAKPENIILPNDIQVTYKTWTPNSKEGTIKWGVIISKGKVSKTLSGTLNNYKKSQEAKEEVFKRDNNKSKRLLSKYTIAAIASLGAVFLVNSGILLKTIKSEKVKRMRK